MLGTKKKTKDSKVILWYEIFLFYTAKERAGSNDKHSTNRKLE